MYQRLAMSVLLLAGGSRWILSAVYCEYAHQ